MRKLLKRVNVLRNRLFSLSHKLPVRSYLEYDQMLTDIVRVLDTGSYDEYDITFILDGLDEILDLVQNSD